MANTNTTFEQIKLLCPFIVLRNSFSVATKKSNSWVAEQFYTCREVFHDDFSRHGNIVISTPQYKLKRLVAFFDIVESIIFVEKKSKLFLTQRKNVYFIKLSNFWNKNIRYSLLTLLIRSALKNKNLVDFDQLIDNNRYLKQTKDALCLFFSGKTEYKGKNKSWYKQFKRMKTDECCKFLHKM